MTRTARQGYTVPVADGRPDVKSVVLTMKASQMEVKPLKGKTETLVDSIWSILIFVLIVWALAKYLLS